MKNKFNSVQEWLPFDKILDNGIIKLKNSSYVKIIEIIPINFNLKSELEKEAILNSYKIFLKTCNFNLQILIQSNKENLEKHISNINIQKKLENKKINEISNNYIKYIQELNKNKKSSNKRFYIIIKNKLLNDKIEENIIEDLNDSLARCGNIVKDINEKEKIERLLLSFLNKRLLYIN